MPDFGALNLFLRLIGELAAYGLLSGIQILFRWQEFAGAMLGVVGAFMVWLASQRYLNKRATEEYLIYLHRVLVDHINALIEANMTIEKFLDTRLKATIARIRSRGDSYSIESVFLPQFSAQSMVVDLLQRSTQSGYTDSKVDRAYYLSKDFPEILNDLRRQLEHTIQVNKELALQKANGARAHNTSYAENLEEFELVVRRDLLGINIPVYMRALVEAQTVVLELRNIGIRRWNWRFHPKYRFFLSKKSYMKAIAENSQKIDSFFEPQIQETLQRTGVTGKKLEEIIPQS